MQGDSKSGPWRCRVGFAVGYSFFGAGSGFRLEWRTMGKV